MNLDFSAEHNDLRRVLHAYLRSHPELHGQAHAASGPAACSASLKDFVTTFGLDELCIPERWGGQGGGLMELAVLAEELGCWLSPSELVNAGLAALVLARAGEQGADGLKVGPDPRRLAYVHVGEDAVLNSGGEAGRTQVSCQVVAPWPCRGADLLVLGLSTGLVMVDLDGPGVELRPAKSLDLTNSSCRVTVIEAPARWLSTSSADARWALGAARLMLAYESLGSMRSLLRRTVEYVGTREQFGAPIGTFQAVKHQAADMAVAVDRVDAVCRWVLALAERADAAEFIRASRVAANIAIKDYRNASQTAIQLHGGIGFTWELGLHLALRRAVTHGVQYGDTHGLSTEIGRDFVLLSASASAS